jgi:hypothetical protein
MVVGVGVVDLLLMLMLVVMLLVLMQEVMAEGGLREPGGCQGFLVPREVHEAAHLEGLSCLEDVVNVLV